MTRAGRLAWLFGRGWLIVTLTAANVGMIAHGAYGPAVAAGFGISFIWYTNTGRASDDRGAFHPAGLGALVVSARDVIFAHTRPEMNAGLADAQWQTAVERACRDMIDRLADDTPAGRLRPAQ